MENTINDSNIIHNLDEQKSIDRVPYSYLFTVLGIVIVIGALVGFGVTKIPKSTKPGELSKQVAKKTVGIADKKTFKDKAEGTLKEGGADGEGNFHLERPGGESQNVYLTSSTVDLSEYVNKKVRVWGETFKAAKAGWLMDVGLVEILQ